MIYPRIAVLPLFTLALTLVPSSGQSVVSTHSGLIYFFTGSVFLGDERLEQKFGRFPDIGEGRELRTEHGRAEVLLTPGVFLRIGENSAIRMLSNKLSDTRVELVRGSAILESTEGGTKTPVKLMHKNWQVRLANQGVYRIDSEPAGLRVYKGHVEVSTGDETDKVAVKEGEMLPLAEVLVPEQSTAAEGDLFKNWAMSRSQAISADNEIAAEIVDNPSQMDGSGVDFAGFSSFPSTGIASLGIINPYGLSFWSPYQSTLSSIYFPSYMYGGLYRGWPGGFGSSFGTYARPIPGQMILPSRIGVTPHPVGMTAPRAPVGMAPARAPVGIAAPRGPAPHVGVGGVHAAGHR
jgi:hypothetical protein